MAKKILICDRCECEITDKRDINLATQGRNGWMAASRAKGTEPRGIIPCRNFIRCGGEMSLTKKSNFITEANR